MPRSGQRSHRIEELNVRHRVAWELKQRGWSHQKLADQLAAVDNPVSKTAVHKLLEGDPPRRLTLNEFAALADVFEVDVAKLLVEQSVFLSAERNQALAELKNAADTLQKGAGEVERVIRARQNLLGDGDRLTEAITEAVQDLEGALDAVNRVFLDARDALFDDDQGDSDRS